MIKGVEKKGRSGQLLHYRNYKIAPYLVIGVKILLIRIFNLSKSLTSGHFEAALQDKSFLQNSLLIEDQTYKSKQ